MFKISEAIFSLPPFISVKEGHEFFLHIGHNGTNLILAYLFLKEPEEGGWDNPYIYENESYTCGFLYLAEWMETDHDFLQSVQEVKSFLERNKLISNEHN